MIKTLLLIFTAVSLLAGCAKNRDVEKQRADVKADDLSKNAFLAPREDGTRGLWLGKVTVINTSDAPAGTLFVGYQGDVQAGYFDFSQHQMQFKSVEGVFQGNETENIKNNVLMNWNITHIDYALDEVDGQTTNKEIVSDFKVWDQKRYFEINWSELKEVSNTTQMFPISSFSFFQCWSPVNIQRVPGSMKIESDHIGFNIEVNYQRLPACASAPQWGEGDFNFTATMKYSFKKMEPSEYQPKLYDNEQDPARYKYGHFQTVRKVLNPKDGRYHNIFMENRWAEKTHNFYFVKGFPEKYKWIWDHNNPQSVFGQTNALLESIGSKLRFEIYEYDKDGVAREFGDLRYSFINFIDQLEAGGTPFGYGPSDTNPFTGEIIAANSMVWTGMLDFYLKMMDDVSKGVQQESSLFKQMNRSLEVAGSSAETAEDLVSDWDQSQGVGKLFKEMAQVNRFAYPSYNSYTMNEAGKIVVPTVIDKYNSLADKEDGADVTSFTSVIMAPLSQKDYSFETRFLEGRPQLKVIEPFNVLSLDWVKRLSDHPHAHNLRQFSKVLDNLQHVSNKKFRGNDGSIQNIVQEHFAHQARVIETNQQGHCIIDAEEFAGGFAGFLKASNLDISDPKVRQDVINTVLFRVSIHEFGHNLNLRHNFYGSVDKDNFGLGKQDSITNFAGANGLKTFEVNEAGLFVEVGDKKRKQVSSSVMDYLRLEDEIDNPWAWEDYDVAAIRDSYEPSGFDDNGKLYLYCTDEHTATSALCNRHDFGTTPSQILMSQIRSYDERYEMRNKRYGRAYWNTSGYAGSMFGTMMAVKEFVPLWRAGLAEDMLRNKLSELGIKNNDRQSSLVEAMNREMTKVMKLSMAFYDGVIQQSRGDRDFRSIYDPTTGALKQMGIMSDKIFAMMFLAGDDAIFYNPDRIMNHNSYLTYSADPTIAAYANRLWRNILTDRQIAMEPWFINFSRFQYAKNATNYNNRDAASLINSMKIIKIDNANDLWEQYGIEMDVSLPTLQTRLPKAETGTFSAGDEVIVVHVDGDYYMTSIAEGDVTYTLFQSALDKVTGAGDDDESITQFNMDVREFHWLYNLAKSGSLQ